MKKELSGLLLFLIAALLLALVGFPLQSAYGYVGLALTELMTLGIALVGNNILGYSFKETFGFSRITLKETGAFALMYAAGITLSLVANILCLWAFPQVGDRLEEVGQVAGASWSIALPLVAMLPAFCEEALFRGVLRKTFENMPAWLSATVIGLLFGVFHLDLWRILPLTVLGIAVSYIVCKTGHFWWGVLFHLLNNLSSVIGEHFGGITVPNRLVPVMAVFGVVCWFLAYRLLTKSAK